MVSIVVYDPASDAHPGGPEDLKKFQGSPWR